MGKKKSVVLMTLITIVTVVLFALVAFPSFSFTFKGSVKNWNPFAKFYDLEADLGGGYYTHYYPEGVISEIEYNSVLEEKTAIGADEAKEYAESYTRHGDTGLYLSTNEEDGVVTKDKDGKYTVTEAFDEAFKATAEAVAARYAQRGYSSFRVSVVDDYALKVEIPSSDKAAGTVFQYFAFIGEFALNNGTENVLEADEDEGVAMTDYIRSFKTQTMNETAYIEVKLTDEGVSKIKEITGDMVEASATTLSFKVGDNTVLQLTVSETIKPEDKALYITAQDLNSAEVMSIVLNSALEAGDTGITFKAVGNNDIATYAPVYGENVVTFMYITVFAVLVIAIALTIVRCKGFGVAVAYSSLAYFIIVTLCLVLVTEAVFEVSVGTVLMLVLGLILNCWLGMRTYEAIKKEFYLGKTVESSVKVGFKKTILGTVDVCAILFGGALAFLIAAAGAHTLAIQALICFAALAFCSLLWTRAINFLMVSAAKDKNKYFGFVREDEDDE